MADEKKETGYTWHLNHKTYRWLTITNLALATQNFFEKLETTDEEKRPIIVRCLSNEIKASDYDNYVLRWLSVPDVKIFAVAGTRGLFDMREYHSWARRYVVQGENESKNDADARILAIGKKLVLYNEKEFEVLRKSNLLDIMSSTCVDTHISYHSAMKTMEF